MKSKKRNTLSLIITVLIVVFTSCDKDRDYTKAATLDILPSEVQTNNKGIFYTSLSFSKYDIRGINFSKEELKNISLQASQFWIESRNLRAGYQIAISISCTDVGTYNATYMVETFDTMSAGIYLDLRDNKYAHFMDNVFYKLLKRKSLDFQINGQVTDNSGYTISNIPILITINNNLDVRVED